MARTDGTGESPSPRFPWRGCAPIALTIAVAAVAILWARSRAAQEEHHVNELLYAFGAECELLYGDQHPGYCLRPGLQIGPNRVSSAGYFGPELMIPKPASTTRIACVGGSNTVGLRWRDAVWAWPDDLRERLALAETDGEPRIEVLNLALNGLTSADLLERFRYLGLKHEPDVVIIYSGWNDTKHCSFFSLRQTTAVEQFFHDGDTHALVELSPWFSEQGAFWAKQRTTRRAALRGYARETGQPLAGPQDLARVNAQYVNTWNEQFNAGELEPEPARWSAEAAQTHPMANLPVSLMRETQFAKNIVALVEEARTAGARVLLLTLPEGVACQFREMYDRRCRAISLSRLGWSAYMRHAHPRLIESLARELELELVDARAHLESVDDPCRHFYSFEHPNDRGHDEVAALVLSALKSAPTSAGPGS